MELSVTHAANLPKPPAGKFCVLKVDESALLNDRYFKWIPQFGRAIWPVDIHPSDSGPIFVFYETAVPYLINKKLVLTVDSGIPAGLRDDWEQVWFQIPWSQKAVAIDQLRARIVLISASGDHFDVPFQDEHPSPGNADDWRQHGWPKIFVLPLRKQVVFVGFRDGKAFLVGDTGVTPWISDGELVQHGIRGILAIFDSQALDATIIVDVDGKIHLLSKNDRIYDLTPQAVFPTDKYAVAQNHFYDLQSQSTAVLSVAASSNPYAKAGDIVIAMHRDGVGSNVAYSVQRLAPVMWPDYEGHYYYSNMFSQLFRFGGGLLGTGRWQVLTGRGFVDIPGGSESAVDDSSTAGALTIALFHVEDLPLIGQSMIGGAGGIYLYDGRSINLVPGTTGEQLGEDLPGVYNLSAIGRVVVVTGRGMFQLTKQRDLVPLKMPFSFAGFWNVALADWPDAGVVLADTQNGLFTIDPKLNAMPVAGGEAVKAPAYDFQDLGAFPPLGGRVILNGNSMFVVVDKALSHTDACH
jgi:hypothetical protein